MGFSFATTEPTALLPFPGVTYLTGVDGVVTGYVDGLEFGDGSNTDVQSATHVVIETFSGLLGGAVNAGLDAFVWATPTANEFILSATGEVLFADFANDETSGVDEENDKFALNHDLGGGGWSWLSFDGFALPGSSAVFNTGGFGTTSGGVEFEMLVPIPAAAWLFASGLGLLGWMRRRQIA